MIYIDVLIKCENPEKQYCEMVMRDLIQEKIDKAVKPYKELLEIKPAHDAGERREMKINKVGCRVSEDVCIVHDEPLICRHGCSEAKDHKCPDIKVNEQHDQTKSPVTKAMDGS